MPIESSNTSNNKSFSQPLKVEKDNVICKDGFCELSNINKNRKINHDDMNLFDPV